MTRCPACGADNWRSWSRVPDTNAPDRVYEIVRCGSCGLGRTIASDEEHARAETFDYGSPRTQPPPPRGVVGRLSAALVRHGVMRRARRAASFGGPVLDVGCWRGDFLDALRRLGARGEGLEPDGPAAESSEGRGFTVHRTTLEQARGDFPVVVLWHVLEHTRDPLVALVSVRGLLSEGGRAIVAVPYPSGLEARAWGIAWQGWQVPRHLWHFPPRALDALIRRAGLSRAARRQATEDTLLGVKTSLKTAVRLAPARAAALLTAPLLRILGHSTSFVVEVVSRG